MGDERGENFSLHGRRARDDGRGSNMRKTVAVVGLVAFVMFLAVGVGEAGPRIGIPKALPWSANVNGTYIDSTYTQIIGTAQSLDTTAVFTTDDWCWNISSTPATAHGVAKLWIVSNSGTIADTDSLFYVVDVSVDGTNFTNYATFQGAAFAAAGDRVLCAPIVIDTDAYANAAGGREAFARFMRIRVRADGNTACRFLNARVYLQPLLCD
jgi:hypothetical protein